MEVGGWAVLAAAAVRELGGELEGAAENGMDRPLFRRFLPRSSRLAHLGARYLEASQVPLRYLKKPEKT